MLALEAWLEMAIVSRGTVNQRAAFFLASGNPIPYKRETSRAQVAQLVEQRTENPRVGGSIPPLGTIS
jgi:hypothetical protein